MPIEVTGWKAARIERGSRDLKDIKGLWHRVPFTAVCSGLGAVITHYPTPTADRNKDRGLPCLSVS